MRREFNQEQKDFSTRIVLIVCLIVGLACAAVGGVLLYNRFSDKAACTEKVQGVVIELRATKTGKKNHKKTAYAPVYQYDYQGTTYTYVSNVYSSPAPFSEGEQIDIMVDPTDPEHIFVPDDNGSLILGLVFGGIGLIFVISCGGLLIGKAVKKKKSALTVEDEISQYYN